MWDHGRVRLVNQIEAEIGVHRVLYMSVDLLDWVIKTISHIRTDMHALGVGPKRCYGSSSTAMHAVLMARQMCSNIDVYGFKPLLNRDLTSSSERPIGKGGHDQDTEAFLFRLLHAAGVIRLCADPDDGGEDHL